MGAAYISVFDNIADTIGEDCALRLVEVAGGQRIYIPESWTVESAVGFLGPELGPMLSEFYGGEHIELPRSAVGPADRQRKARRLFNDGESINRIAATTGVTERHARRMLRGVRFEPSAAISNRIGVIVSAWSDGKSMSEIAALCDSEPHTVLMLAKRLGLPPIKENRTPRTKNAALTGQGPVRFDRAETDVRTGRTVSRAERFSADQADVRRADRQRAGA